MNENNIIVLDFETGGVDPKKHEAISVAGKAYNGRTLEPFKEGGEFDSLMKPLHFDRLEPGALRVNNITVEELEKAPDQALVWKQFVTWVNKFNVGKTKNKWRAPIACGKNIRNFDLKFVDELNKLHMPKGENTVLFNARREIDLEDFIFYFWENSNELPNEKMDTLREYFNMSTEGAHEALTDVLQTGELVMFFLKLNRWLLTLKKGDKPWLDIRERFLQYSNGRC